MRPLRDESFDRGEKLDNFPSRREKRKIFQGAP